MGNVFPHVVIVILCATGAVAQPAPSTTASPASSTKPGAPLVKAGFVLPAEKAQPIRMPKFEKPPVIDGKLDDEIWKQAAILKDFYQVQPGDNIAPSKPTEVLLGYVGQGSLTVLIQRLRALRCHPLRGLDVTTLSEILGSTCSRLPSR